MPPPLAAQPGRARRSSARRSRRRRAASPPGGARPAGRPAVPHTWAITAAGRARRAPGELAGGIGMRAVAEHDVEQYAADVVGHLAQHLQAHARGRPSGAGGPACTPPRRGRSVTCAVRRCRRSPRIGSRIAASCASEPPENRPSTLAAAAPRGASASVAGGGAPGGRAARRPRAWGAPRTARRRPSQPTNAATTRLPRDVDVAERARPPRGPAAWTRAAASRSPSSAASSRMPSRNISAADLARRGRARRRR